MAFEPSGSGPISWDLCLICTIRTWIHLTIRNNMILHLCSFQLHDKAPWSALLSLWHALKGGPGSIGYNLSATTPWIIHGLVVSTTLLKCRLLHMNRGPLAERFFDAEDWGGCLPVTSPRKPWMTASSPRAATDQASKQVSAKGR